MRILPIFISHMGCPFKCIYCNQFDITKSVGIDFEKISNEIKNFNPRNLLESEIAFYGGTFTGLNIDLQKKLLNIAAKYAPQVPIRISTRPDFISQEIIEFLKNQNVKTIELGIQSFSDNVLKLSKRGYTSKEAISACKIVKNNKLKLSIQLMPGLLGFSEKTLAHTLDITKTLSPEYLRIYPTVVLKNTKLEKMYLSGEYQPLSLDEAIKIVAKIHFYFEDTDTKIIKTGLHSDISDFVAGPYHESFGELVKIELYKNRLKSKFQKEKTLTISSKDISLFKGFDKKLLNKIKANFDIDKLPIKFDKNLQSGSFYFSNVKPDKYW